MLRVGLTGGIATGKTRVRARLAERGLHTLDLDEVAHAVTEPGRPAYDEIVAAFGTSVLAPDGRIDRRALGAIVFTHASARERLNAIVHPRVFEEENLLVARLAPAKGAVVVTDATLLVESGYHIRFDRLVVTYCERRQQLGRLMARDGVSAGAAQARIASQMDGAEKARYGHYRIDTGGDLQATDTAADALADDLKRLAAAWRGPEPVETARALGTLVRGPGSGPGGLSPARFIASVLASGAPSLPLLAHELVPPKAGSWYEPPAEVPAAGPGPASLMAPLLLWARAWYGRDRESLLAAAVSLARLTHASPGAWAEAASVALALAEIADTGAVPADLAARVRAQADRVERWTGGGVPAAVDRLLAAVAGQGQPQDEEQAELVGALQGLAGGADPAQAPRELVASLDRLSAIAADRGRLIPRS
jgi:dephospho-CoA kinase